MSNVDQMLASPIAEAPRTSGALKTGELAKFRQDVANAIEAVRATPIATLALYAVIAVLYVVLFARPARSLVDAWWNDPNNGQGLLLAPLSIGLAWRSGLAPGRAPNRLLGGVMLIGAVLARYASELAAELFVMNASGLLALAGLVVWYGGMRQLLRWWLPFTLVTLSVPIPEVILNTVALPLQFTASKIGAALLRWRQIPVVLSGNVIHIPRQDLFVAEACSGLRSLTALLSIGVLLGALYLERIPSRILLVALSVPVAILINGFRVFLTGFLVLYVSPEMGKGFMHESEGMLTFGTAFLVLSGLAWAFSHIERLFSSRRPSTEATA